MRTARMLMVITVACLGLVEVAGAQGIVPPPPRPRCDTCQPPVERLGSYEREQQRLRHQIAEVDKEIAEIEKQIAEDRAQLEKLRSDSSIPLFQRDELTFEAEARLRRRSMQRALRAEDRYMWNARLSELETTLLPEARAEVDRCNRSCSGGESEPTRIGTVPGGTGAVEPQCEPCEAPADELKRLEDERRQLTESVDRLDGEIRQLEALNASEEQGKVDIRNAVQQDPRRAPFAEDMLKRTQQRIDDNNSALDAKRGARERARQRRDEIDGQLPGLRDRIRSCNESCPLPAPTSQNRRWLLFGGAAAVGGALIAGAGGSDPEMTTVSTPIVPPQTAANPPVTTPSTPPTTAPSPAPTVSASGNYLCAACTIRNDAGRHDPTLRVCNGVTSTFTVVEGSLTIRHPAPFIDVTGANYNTATGAFELSGNGSIAGFSNVAVRAVGTVDNQTGRITFDYTLGSNGVFPGGQPITYSITLQKQ